MELVKVNFDTDDIIQAIIKCHELYKSDTVGIAPKLKGSNLVATCRNIHDYVYRTIKYKLDENGVQFAKRPNRTLTEKEGDCKSMSLLAGSILHNLGIPFSFRFASYDGKEYTHVYIVAHGNRNVIIDPVWTLSGGAFDTEKQTNGKPKDYKMRPALYIGSTRKIGEISDKDFFNKYYPPVADMLVRLNRTVVLCVDPYYRNSALSFLQALGSDARNDQAKLLIFNGYANLYLSGKSDWLTTFKALAVVMAWKAPLGIGNIFSDAWESTKDFVRNVGDNVGDKFRQFTDWAGNVVKDASQAAASAAARVANKSKEVTISFANWSTSGVKDFLSDPKKFLKTEVESLKENAQKVWDKTKEFTLAPMRAAFMVVLYANMFGLADKVAKGGKAADDVWVKFGGKRDYIVRQAQLAVITSNQSDVRKGVGAAPAAAAPLIVAITSALGVAATVVKVAADAKQLATNTKDEINKVKSDFENLIGKKAVDDAEKERERIEKEFQELQDLGGNPIAQAGLPMWAMGLMGLAVVGTAAYAGSGKRRK